MEYLHVERQAAWRTLGQDLLRLLDERGNGLVITVDEIHAADRSGLARLTANVQHFIQDRLPIGLVFAGLLAVVSDLLNEAWQPSSAGPTKSTCTSPPCGRWKTLLPPPSPKHPSRSPPALVRHAAEATGGYPFLIQLVGYFLWKEAETTRETSLPRQSNKPSRRQTVATHAQSSALNHSRRRTGSALSSCAEIPRPTPRNDAAETYEIPADSGAQGSGSGAPRPVRRRAAGHRETIPPAPFWGPADPGHGGFSYRS